MPSHLAMVSHLSMPGHVSVSSHLSMPIKIAPFRNSSLMLCKSGPQELRSLSFWISQSATRDSNALQSNRTYARERRERRTHTHTGSPQQKPQREGERHTHTHLIDMWRCMPFNRLALGGFEKEKPSSSRRVRLLASTAGPSSASSAFTKKASVARDTGFAATAKRTSRRIFFLGGAAMQTGSS